jgi:hypothetical protein
MQCFLCQRPIQADDQGVYDATLWRTGGNFGSRVYDPLTEGTFLEIAICDGCLAARKHLVEEVVTVHRVDEVSRRPAELS